MKENHSSARRHELLTGVAEHTAMRLIEKHGLTVDQAAEVGNDLADWLAEYFGGQAVYFVKDAGVQLDERDHQIFLRMRRGNAHELAAEFGISYVRVHQIYRRRLKEARGLRQPQLFADAEIESPL